MRYRQAFVAIQAATPGMVLAAPANAVTAGAMVFSLPVGHVLTDDNIHQLDRHRVEFIVVSAPDLRTDSQIAEDQSRTAGHLDKIFAGANLSEPCTTALYAQVLAFQSA